MPFPRPCGATGNDARKLHALAFAHVRGALLMHEVLYNEAAVGGEDLTGDKACPLRGEECHGVGDVLRCAQTAQRRFADQLLHGLLPQHLDHISVDDAGGHAVYPDAGGGQFHSQRPGQGDDTRLCAGVSHLAACPPLAPDGGNIYDAAPFFRDHVGEGRLDGVPGAAQIYRQIPVPHLVSGVLKQPLTRHTGVVYHQLYRAEGLAQLPDHLGHGSAVRDIGLEHGGMTARCRQFLHQLPGLVRPIQVVDAYSPALMG